MTLATLSGKATLLRPALGRQSVPLARIRSSARTHLPGLVSTGVRWNNHSSAERGSGRGNGSRSAAGLVIGTIGGVSLGYYIAQQQLNQQLNGTRSTLDAQYGTPQDFQKAITRLRTLFPEDSISTDPDELQHHGYSVFDHHPESMPSVVVFPESTEDVVKIVEVANMYKMPVVPYSGATSLEGHFRAPSTGSICVDVSRMSKVLEIHEEDSDLVCQPGANWVEINAMLKQKGIPLFFPLDPAPGATIGGMISTGCSGTNAVRYGTAKAEWILNVTVVLPSGEVIKTRRRSRKSSAGFDTTKLFIGAEGTLGIITEATLRLAPVLPTTVAVAQFPDVRAATEAVREVLNKGVAIQCVELCDNKFMALANTMGSWSRKWEEKDSIFFKFQGPTARATTEGAELAHAICKKHGGTGFVFARDDDEAEQLWDVRKTALLAGLSAVENARVWSTDVCVPVSRLPDLVYQTKEDLENNGLMYAVVGHVGDGNFHAGIVFRGGDEQALQTAREAVDRMNKRAIALDGTCTGEHGVGLGKKKYLVEELGQGTVDLMKAVKKTLDPHNLFNPGKLYPESTSS